MKRNLVLLIVAILGIVFFRLRLYDAGFFCVGILASAIFSWTSISVSSEKLRALMIGVSTIIVVSGSLMGFFIEATWATAFFGGICIGIPLLCTTFQPKEIKEPAIS